MKSSRAFVFVACALATTATAQQFQNQPGIFPNTVRWTEGVEAADVDNDGDFDIFFSEGDGFMSAGMQRQNILLINQLIGSGSLSFTNESVARLGSNLSNGKGVLTGDIDADGWIDALYANGFNTDVPFLYHNRGASQPGFFDLESAARGFTEAISSASGQFGDPDDDGDLDVILNDSGNSFLGGAGGRPRYYQNDGSGQFTEVPGMMGAGTKIAHMDVQFVDMDGDFDLDFFGPNRNSNGGAPHYLILNDGTGNFASDISGDLPTNSSNTYEAEAGDLDGDNDIDMFFVSLAGFGEGPIFNNIAQGMSTFSAGATIGGDDDNEIALFDFDNDGDYDALVGSLSGNAEKMLRNNGSGVFSNVAGDFPNGSDSTLDVAVVDIDNDGDYDVITAQGESGNFLNKLYLNTGSADTLAPVITATDVPAGPNTSGDIVAHAKIRDQVSDDAKSWVSGCVNYVTTSGVPTAAVTYNGPSFTPAVLNVTAGTTVTWTSTSPSTGFINSTTAPYTYSEQLDPGQTVSITFVEPGTYQYTDLLGTPSGTINVTGTTQKLGALQVGTNMHRVEMTPGAGSQVCYEWRFTDYAGNVSASTGTCVSLGAVINAYCTAKASSAGCLASISTTDSAAQPVSGAGGYSVTASDVHSIKNGLLFAGLSGSAAIPFNGGTLCVQPPTKRGPITGSFGVGPNTCTGTYSTLVNDGNVIPAGLDAGMGNSAWYQYWYRDPANGAGQLGTALLERRSARFPVSLR